MGPTPFYGARAEKKQKADFAMKQTNICRLSGDINIIFENLLKLNHIHQSVNLTVFVCNV